MDACLTQQIPVSLPIWRKYSKAPVIKGYSQITSITPILEEFLGASPDSEGQLNSDELFGKVVSFDDSSTCVIETVDRKKHKSYCKVSHLLDPTRTLQDYYVHEKKGERRRLNKLNNPGNQAYVDTLANYLLGQLRERKVSPHFCKFYGAFKGVADTYRYDISEEFESYRKYRDFWERRREGKFKLHIEREDCESVGSDASEIFGTPKSSLRSTAFSYTTESESEGSYTSLSLPQGDNLLVVESLDDLKSVHSFTSSPSSSSDSDGSSDSDDSDSSDNMYSVYAELNNYPVMLIFQEKMEGVLDDLLEENEPEVCWTAWTFQIIAALCAAQGVLGFTHNDLHTNNIVWDKTEESWLFYKSRDGTVWRVPTYGRIFRIIDFGRSIFRVGEKWFISDDYEEGGDAEGQYNFGKLADKKEKEKKKTLVYPNPSFDLCRYSVSIIDALYAEMPVERLDGLVLSKEGDWVIRETESPLWNLLWEWLVDKDGNNVLRDEDGTERFPDFDLYQHISENVMSAKPQDQIHKKIFESYKISPSEVGSWETVYPLFC